MLSLTNVYKSYKYPVLSDVSLSCEKGEILCIAGANGSGKSTLLSIMTGLLKPDSGKVIREGEIGYAPQDNGLFENISVKDNLDFWAKARKRKPDYSFFPASDLKKKVAQLSAGMKKKLIIYIAISSDYDFLVMDEPSCSFDFVYQKFIIDIIEESKRKNKGVVFTSHNLTEIRVSDKLCVLESGSVVYYGKTEDFCNSGEDCQEKMFALMKIK